MKITWRIFLAIFFVILVYTIGVVVIESINASRQSDNSTTGTTTSGQQATASSAQDGGATAGYGGATASATGDSSNNYLPSDGNASLTTQSFPSNGTVSTSQVPSNNNSNVYLPANNGATVSTSTTDAPLPPPPTIDRAGGVVVTTSKSETETRGGAAGEKQVITSTTSGAPVGVTAVPPVGVPFGGAAVFPPVGVPLGAAALPPVGVPLGAAALPPVGVPLGAAISPTVGVPLGAAGLPLGLGATIVPPGFEVTHPSLAGLSANDLLSFPNRIHRNLNIRQVGQQADIRTILAALRNQGTYGDVRGTPFGPTELLVLDNATHFLWEWDPSTQSYTFRAPAGIRGNWRISYNTILGTWVLTNNESGVGSTLTGFPATNTNNNHNNNDDNWWNSQLRVAVSETNRKDNSQRDTEQTRSAFQQRSRIMVRPTAKTFLVSNVPSIVRLPANSVLPARSLSWKE